MTPEKSGPYRSMSKDAAIQRSVRKPERVLSDRGNISVGDHGNHNKSSNNMSNVNRLNQYSRLFSAPIKDNIVELQRSGRTDTFQINVGKKKHPLLLNDPVFKLQGPILYDRSQESLCIVCDAKMGKSDINFCQFCGHRACKKCANQMRMFAGQAERIDRKQA